MTLRHILCHVGMQSVSTRNFSKYKFIIINISYTYYFVILFLDIIIIFIYTCIILFVGTFHNNLFAFLALNINLLFAQTACMLLLLPNTSINTIISILV